MRCVSPRRLAEWAAKITGRQDLQNAATKLGQIVGLAAGYEMPVDNQRASSQMAPALTRSSLMPGEPVTRTPR